MKILATLLAVMVFLCFTFGTADAAPYTYQRYTNQSVTVAWGAMVNVTYFEVKLVMLKPVAGREYLLPVVYINEITFKTPKAGTFDVYVRAGNQFGKGPWAQSSVVGVDKDKNPMPWIILFKLTSPSNVKVEPVALFDLNKLIFETINESGGTMYGENR